MGSVSHIIHAVHCYAHPFSLGLQPLLILCKTFQINLSVHVIRDLSTKAASDGMGDELERFARGEKLRLSDQRQIYKERVQEIWRRQIAALSADPGNEVVRSESTIGAVNDSNEVEGANKSGAEKDIASDDSDDEDDDFAAMLEMDMTSTGDANRLLAAQLNESGDGSMRTIGRSLDTQELSKDAREFAALQRQREEERAMQDGLDKKSTLGPDDTKRKKFKCIRRKITKVSIQYCVFNLIAKFHIINPISRSLSLRLTQTERKL